MIDKIKKDNPELPVKFIEDAIKATKEINEGKTKPFTRRVKPY